MDTIRCQTVIVGGGLVGSSLAMNLARQGHQDIVVLDLDMAGGLSSSELNAGGVRATWHHPVNASLARVSIDYFEGVRDEIGFLQRGYFWMYNKAEWLKASARLKANSNLKSLGIEYISPAEISKRHPFIDRTEDLGGATFSPKDGLINPNLLKLHYREQARNGGVKFLDRHWVYAVENLDGDEKNLQAWLFPQGLNEDAVKEILVFADGASFQERALGLGAKILNIKARNVVNCSGPWAKRFARAIGQDSPCYAVRRQVCFFESRDVSLHEQGMFVDSSGVYFHAEGDSILSGFATPGETPGYNYEYDGESFFNDYIWSALYNRSSKLENLKHVTGWAGLYEVSPDHSAVIGAVKPFRGIYEAHSFSGRGAMQSYAAGLALAELMIHGKSSSVKIDGLDGGRFTRGERVTEDLLI